MVVQMKLLVVLASACVLLHHGVFGVEEITLFVVQGDRVTLHTGVKTNQQDRIRWYFNDIRLAQITGRLCKICTDVQCDKRFRDRLELDNQTGSLTIKSIMTSDAGFYKLKILDSPSSEKIFNVTVHDSHGDTPALNTFLRDMMVVFVGAVLAALIVAVGVIWFCRKHKRKYQKYSTTDRGNTSKACETL